MPAAVPLPDQLPLPAPAGLLAGLLHLTLLLHLVSMNLLLGGGLIAFKWRILGRPSDAPHRREILDLYVRSGPWLMAATVSLGVAPLLFVQVLHGRLFFTSAILMGGLWLAVVPLLTLAYVGIDLLALRAAPEARGARLVAAGVVLLLVIVAFLYTSNFSLMIRPEAFLHRYRSAPMGLLPPLGDPTLIPRFLHNLLGGVAVAGMAVALLGAGRLCSSPEASGWALRRGLGWFFGSTTLNVGVGLWFLLALPRPTLQRLAGADPWSTTLLTATIVLGFALLGAAPLALQSKTPARAARRLAPALGLMLTTMVLLRDQVRGAALARAGLTIQGEVATQWGPMASFAVAFVLGIFAVVWMLRTFLRGK